jgi:hypothetical protein
MNQNLVEIFLWVGLGERERDSIRAHSFLYVLSSYSVGHFKQCQCFSCPNAPTASAPYSQQTTDMSCNRLQTNEWSIIYFGMFLVFLLVCTAQIPLRRTLILDKTMTI